jgi:hypothetical protein
MVINMNEAQVRTVAPVREVLAGTHLLERAAVADDTGRYAWIETALNRLGYPGLGRAERGVVLEYLRHLSGYSRAQLTRLVTRWLARQRLAKRYCAPKHAFARRYSRADIALLAAVDKPWACSQGLPPPAPCAGGLWR